MYLNHTQHHNRQRPSTEAGSRLRSRLKTLAYLGHAVLLSCTMMTATAAIPEKAQANDNELYRPAVNRTAPAGISGTGKPPFSRLATITEQSPGKMNNTRVNYEVIVSKQQRRQSLVLDGTLGQKVDRDTLMQLSDLIYEENRGYDYDKVQIQWKLSGEPRDSQPWALSDITKEDTVIRVITP